MAQCAERSVLEILEHVPAWYDGSRGGCRAVGRNIPFGARMLAVVEAFDSMTTDQVYRRAMPEERAMNELFESAGRQFDPELLRNFAEFRLGDPSQRRREAAARWLQTLDPQMPNPMWQLNTAAPVDRIRELATFEEELLDHMHDAVVFVDTGSRIVGWNHGAERLTGIAADCIFQHPWSPTLVHLHNEKGGWIAEDDCPVLGALRTRTQSLQRLTICGPTGRPVPVDSHAIPVAAEDGSLQGAVLVLHDASSEISLEERCLSLHERATKDPLTQVANRAEFDRVHEMFVHAHREQQVPCSLMICDLDRFKQVNDTFGHQAGDEAIKALAAILRNCCHSGDLVARYGGEEFVMLYANCDIASAARRAEQIRRTLAHFAVPKLGKRKITASFGVTEIQPGDTPETMLRRADRALLLAKERGRNTVVQLGMGFAGDTPPEKKRPWWKGDKSPLVLQQDLVAGQSPWTSSSRSYEASWPTTARKILKVDGDRVELQVDDDRAGITRRASDRPVAFRIELWFEEQPASEPEQPPPGPPRGPRTRLHICVISQRNQDRRHAVVAERARELLTSLRCYLTATNEPKPSSGGLLQCASGSSAGGCESNTNTGT